MVEKAAALSEFSNTPSLQYSMIDKPVYRINSTAYLIITYISLKTKKR